MKRPREWIKLSVRVVHDESSSTFAAWRHQVKSFGQVRFRTTSVKNTLFASRFTSQDRTLVRSSEQFERGKLASVPGVWWLWPAPIVVPPWRAVRTWEELFHAGQAAGVDVLGSLKEMARAARGLGPSLLMLGYPMPRTWGGANVEVHWETLHLPELTRDAPKGFRPTPAAWWRRDRIEVFGDRKALPYARTENWHPSRLRARGRLPDNVRTQRITIIGCGALGGIVAEMLVRAGVEELELIDGDTLVVGNLVRHVLTTSDLGQQKASALARRLRTISPALQVEPHDYHLPPEPASVEKLLKDADVVIDCTAADDVPLSLAQPMWNVPKLFLSASFGFAAQRLYVFRGVGARFSADTFRNAVEPWLAQERSTWAEIGEITEGAGCYSPLFPARMDDIAAGAIAVVRILEDTIVNNHLDDELIVLQSEPPFGGLRQVTDPSDVETKRLPV